MQFYTISIFSLIAIYAFGLYMLVAHPVFPLTYSTTNQSNVNSFVAEIFDPSLFNTSVSTIAPNVSAISNPTVSSWGEGHLNVFVLGSDGSIWYNPYFNGSWHIWNHVGNAGDAGHPNGITLNSAPTAISWNVYKIDVFAKGTDNKIWQISYNRHTDRWSTWSSLPVNSNSSSSPTSFVPLDFETGNLYQWIKGPKTTTAINNCHEYHDPTNRLDVVKSPVKQGAYALKVTLESNAIVIPNTGKNGERAELKYCDSPRHVHLFKNGEDVWYHWYTNFSNQNFTIPIPITSNKWHVWTQWHGLRDTMYDLPLTFNLNGDKLNLRVMPLVYDSQQCYIMQIGQCGYMWIEPVQKGKWYEVLLHVKWSTGSNGLVEGWIKKEGANKIPFVTYKGNTLDPNGSEGVYLKQGLYRNPIINVQQVLWHDGMAIAKCPTGTQFDPATNRCNTTLTIIESNAIIN